MAHYVSGRIAEKNKDTATAEREYRDAIAASNGGALAWLNQLSSIATKTASTTWNKPSASWNPVP